MIHYFKEISYQSHLGANGILKKGKISKRSRSQAISKFKRKEFLKIVWMCLKMKPYLNININRTKKTLILIELEWLTGLVLV